MTREKTGWQTKVISWLLGLILLGWSAPALAANPTVAVYKDTVFDKASDFNYSENHFIYDNILPFPENRITKTNGNTAYVYLSATRGQAGEALAEVGVQYDWDLGSYSWDQVKDQKVSVTIDFTYEISADYVIGNGSANAGVTFRIIEPWYDFVGYERSNYYNKRTSSLTIDTTVGKAPTIISGSVYCQAHCGGLNYHSSYSSLTINSITIHPERPKVILVHGWRGSPETWSYLTDRLGGENIDYITFDYSLALGDPKQCAENLNSWIEQYRNDSGYSGKFDIVCHSMGAMVSRWYMEKLDGANSIRQWIGIAPVNHGAAIADRSYLMSLLNALFFFAPGYLIGSEPAVQAMKTNSDILSDLNYNSPHFNLSVWKTNPENLSSGVIYRVLAGLNETLTPGYSPLTNDKTYVVKKDIKGKRYYYWTRRGDSIVPLYLSELQGAGIDCFEGANHNSICGDSRALDRIITYLKNPNATSLNNYPIGKDLDDDHSHNGGNQGMIHMLLLEN